jgi:hypothetical protein
MVVVASRRLAAKVTTSANADENTDDPRSARREEFISTIGQLLGGWFSHELTRIRTGGIEEPSIKWRSQTGKNVPATYSQ